MDDGNYWIRYEVKRDDPMRRIHRFEFRCSKCGDHQGYGPTPYCMWCGAKMNAEVREEGKE